MANKFLTKRPIKFFGAALDALDVPEAVDIKRSYIENLLSAEREFPESKDPYAFFKATMTDRLKECGHQYLGRFAVESWLTPKPEIADLDWVGQESYNQFLRNDGFRIFSELLRDFVKFHLFPSIPGMVGVDHSLTGGVLMALSEHIGSENLGVLVFDAHTDAVPLPLRSALVRYASEAGKTPAGEITIDESFAPYTTGSFLLYLMDNDFISPENLVIVGVGDSANGLRHLTDDRVKKYVNYYDSLIERGVHIVDQSQIKTEGPGAIRDALTQLRCAQLYVSLDVDVSAHCGVLATRFTDVAGIEISSVIEMIHIVGEFLSSHRFSLAGLDIMEIDVYKLGAKLKNGIEDQTQHLMIDYINTLCGS